MSFDLAQFIMRSSWTSFGGVLSLKKLSFFLSCTSSAPIGAPSLINRKAAPETQVVLKSILRNHFVAVCRFASSVAMTLFLTLVGCQAQPLLQCWKFYKHPFRVRPLNVVKTQSLIFLLIQPSFPFRKSLYKATLFSVYRNITLSGVSLLSRTYAEL